MCVRWSGTTGAIRRAPSRRGALPLCGGGRDPLRPVWLLRVRRLPRRRTVCGARGGVAVVPSAVDRGKRIAAQGGWRRERSPLKRRGRSRGGIRSPSHGRWAGRLWCYIGNRRRRGSRWFLSGHFLLPLHEPATLFVRVFRKAEAAVELGLHLRFPFVPLRDFVLLLFDFEVVGEFALHSFPFLALLFFIFLRLRGRATLRPSFHVFFVAAVLPIQIDKVFCFRCENLLADGRFVLSGGKQCIFVVLGTFGRHVVVGRVLEVLQLILESPVACQSLGISPRLLLSLRVVLAPLFFRDSLVVLLLGLRR